MFGGVAARQGGRLRRGRGPVGTLLPLLRCAFPRARFLVRLDGGFASPALFDFLGAQPRLDYVVAMASNAVLLRHAEPAMLVARARSERSEQTEHLYMDTDYAAGRGATRAGSSSRPKSSVSGTASRGTTRVSW